jgi:hypothetical protein
MDGYQERAVMASKRKKARRKLEERAFEAARAERERRKQTRKKQGQQDSAEAPRPNFLGSGVSMALRAFSWLRGHDSEPPQVQDRAAATTYAGTGREITEEIQGAAGWYGDGHQASGAHEESSLRSRTRSVSADSC